MELIDVTRERNCQTAFTPHPATWTTLSSGKFENRREVYLPKDHNGHGDETGRHPGRWTGGVSGSVLMLVDGIRINRNDSFAWWMPIAFRAYYLFLAE